MSLANPAARVRRLSALYRHHFRSPRRERMFVSSLSFFLTFAAVRGITHAIRAGVGPFHDITAGRTHIHHSVWGILLVHLVGYLWLLQLATGDPASRRGSAGTAFLYGAGSALALDEFALWLNLQDVYWAREGRESVDAVILFGALLSIGVWGGPFFHAVTRELLRTFRASGQ